MGEHCYKTVNDAAYGLLGQVCDLIQRSNKKLDYIVVGGWSPYLLSNKNNEHPGTKDVDILFKDADVEYNLDALILNFLEEGFLVSAKHPFQLIKIINVGSKEFAFNVDFLHPSESVKNPELFVDHLVLDIPEKKYRGDFFTLKSIALPETKVLFDGFYEVITREITTPIGHTVRPTFKLMDSAGCLITKSQSIKNGKRPRDAFDVFLALKNTDKYDILVEKIINLKIQNEGTFNTLYGIREAYEDGKGYVFKNIKLFERKSNQYDKDVIRRTFEGFFSDVGLDCKAQ